MEYKSRFTSTVLVAVALLFAGCTHTRVVYPDDPADRSVAKLSRMAKRGRVLVVVVAQPRQSYTVRQLQVLSDSTSWFDSRSGEFEVVETRRIQEIRFVNKGEGAIIGFVSALAVGAATGAVLGFRAGDSPAREKCTSFVCLGDSFRSPWDSAREKAGGYAAIGGVAGALVGMVAGGAVGRVHRYRVHVPPSVVPYPAEVVTRSWSKESWSKE